MPLRLHKEFEDILVKNVIITPLEVYVRRSAGEAGVARIAFQIGVEVQQLADPSGAAPWAPPPPRKTRPARHHSFPGSRSRSSTLVPPVRLLLTAIAPDVSSISSSKSATL